MPRPQQKTIQLTIDGREVEAIEGAMLVDAAKQGDVEIPYFCYEPKLGSPVGACRMCLVEIEGIPKLQTSCSTPVKDGMVVHTQTDRVRHAQNAVVEFLLINHPLDCPVCDKGGECPLQDITFGWGLGRSRMIEPKRHFQKPLALSPLVAIDRERCILCYRCVRFSQEVAEDYQLVFAERGADSYVATHDGHPYVAPFSGNIIELCPVGALTSQPYRFRARPWDIEGAGGICTLCPSQCNVTFTVRDDVVMRVLARDNPGVDDGWLCDKGRFAYQAIHVDERITKPLVRDGGELREVSWERALSTAAGLGRHKGHVGALLGGQVTNEEGFLLQRLMREGLDSSDIDSRTSPGVDANIMRALSAPPLQATVPDLEFAHTVLLVGVEPLDDAPILDLRIRKGVRRNGVKLAVASARPSALDANAAQLVRHAPGSEYELLKDLALTLGGEDRGNTEVAALADLLRDGGEDVVIVWSERIGSDAGAALFRIAELLGLADHEGAGLLEVPCGANGRGLREVGAIPDAGPGFTELPGHATGRERRRDRPGRRRRGADRSVSAPDRPDPRPARSRPVGPGSAQRGAGRRPRLGADRGVARARHGHLPGRVPRREGRHGGASRRPSAAATDRHCAPGSGALHPRRAGRGLPAGRPADRGSSQRGCVRRARQRRPVLRRAHAGGDRRTGCSLARARRGNRGDGRERPDRGAAHGRRGGRHGVVKRSLAAGQLSARSGPRPRWRSPRRCSI